MIQGAYRMMLGQIFVLGREKLLTDFACLSMVASMDETHASPTPPQDYDSPWKEILERYFKDFLAFFFPAAHAGIDWSREYVFLDKELQQVVRDAELGRRFVDKLARVSTTEGDEAWVVLHVEVQGDEETAFARRMFIYAYRLFDRYNQRVVSVAVLADDRNTWRPTQFGYALWGYEIRMRFPMVKLLDYAGREAELEASGNPFGVVVLAYLKTRATRKDPEKRLEWKLRLIRMLYERGYAKADILELFRMIDWMMTLPDALAKRFDEVMFQYEEERKMQYVTSVERHGIEKGRQEGRQEGLLQHAHEAVIENLEVRFAHVPDDLIATIQTITDLAWLKHLHRSAITVDSLEEFIALVADQPTTS